MIERLYQASQAYVYNGLLKPAEGGRVEDESLYEQLEELTAIHESERRQQKIHQLTAEKEFQNTLLDQKNWFITGLIGACLIGLAFWSSVRANRAQATAPTGEVRA